MSVLYLDIHRIPSFDKKISFFLDIECFLQYEVWKRGLLFSFMLTTNIQLPFLKHFSYRFSEVLHHTVKASNIFIHIRL